MSKAKRVRRLDFDLLRVASMAAVVYLHTAADGLRQSENMLLWHLSNLLSSLAVAAVPLFFMLSGALLLTSDKTDDPAYVFRRLPRVAVPGLCWSLLVVAGVWLTQGGEMALLKFVNLPAISALTPYWFLYALVPMYLLSPLLKRMTDHLEERHWRYLLGLWVVVTLGLNQLSGFLPDPWYALLRENTTLNVSILEGYLGYFLLGAWLERLERTPARRTLLAVALGSWAVIALGTWIVFLITGTYGEQFATYRGVFTMALSASLFLLFKDLFRGRRSSRNVVLLSACSFGVYLAHPMAIAAIKELLGGALSAPAQLAVWLLALTGCVLGTVLAASVPGLCFLATGQRFRDACRESNVFALLRRRKPGGKRLAGRPPDTRQK
ncbi:acyltransferase [uncultured Pseudoflavonifractor sp.]|uniref:acyltransferase n=1 Tax=uncultured Pseudoflavonifractor sp. TaxID=1221379 RepID=UPI0025D01C29|nr:acyltransferase [uncultured Pseudoflavonifractor sp.]